MAALETEDSPEEAQPTQRPPRGRRSKLDLRLSQGGVDASQTCEGRGGAENPWGAATLRWQPFRFTVLSESVGVDISRSRYRMGSVPHSLTLSRLSQTVKASAQVTNEPAAPARDYSHTN